MLTILLFECFIPCKMKINSGRQITINNYTLSEFKRIKINKCTLIYGSAMAVTFGGAENSFTVESSKIIIIRVKLDWRVIILQLINVASELRKQLRA